MTGSCKGPIVQRRQTAFHVEQQNLGTSYADFKTWSSGANKSGLSFPRLLFQRSASVSKRVFIQNLSNENEFDLQDNEPTKAFSCEWLASHIDSF